MTTTKPELTIVSEDAPSTAIAPATDRTVNLAGALHINRTFASAANVSGDGFAPRRLTWLTGNNECFAANGKTPLPAARGWFIDQPDGDELFPADYELLDAMEALCEQGKARECVVAHPETTGAPRKVPSWQLLSVSLFVVCEGVPGKREMLDDPECRWGVAYAWPRGTDERGKALTSQLSFTAFIKELLDAGYAGTFTVRFSSYLTDRALACLKAQEYVLRFAESLRAAASEGSQLPYYAYALPIGVSVNTLTAGTEAGKTRQLYYPVPLISRLSKRQPEEALSYLESMAISEEQAFLIEDAGRVDAAVRWSVDLSKRILGGMGDVDEGTEAGGAPTAGTVDITGAPF